MIFTAADKAIAHPKVPKPTPISQLGVIIKYFWTDIEIPALAEKAQCPDLRPVRGHIRFFEVAPELFTNTMHLVDAECQCNDQSEACWQTPSRGDQLDYSVE